MHTTIIIIHMLGAWLQLEVKVPESLPRYIRRSRAAMGGGGSKQAQLERYGQLLSPAERQALETTFHAIAGSQEAAAITETQLRVRRQVNS